MLRPGQRRPPFRPRPEREHHIRRLHGLWLFVVARRAFGQHRRREGHPEIAILDGLVDGADRGRRIRARQDRPVSQRPRSELRGAFRPGDDPALGQLARHFRSRCPESSRSAVPRAATHLRSACFRLAVGDRLAVIDRAQRLNGFPALRRLRSRPRRCCSIRLRRRETRTCFPPPAVRESRDWLSRS